MRIDRIRKILTDALSPTHLAITNQSHLHHSHFKSENDDETHLSIAVVSDEFDGMTRVNRHRRVNALLEAEFQSGLHALKLNTYSPSEWQSNN